MKTEDASRIYLLITTLNAALYAIAELEPLKMTHENKYRLSNLRNAIKTYLTLVSKRAAKNEIQLIDTYSFDNVAIMAELNCMLAHVPANQVEWYVEQCKKLIFSSINKEVNEAKSRDTETT